MNAGYEVLLFSTASLVRWLTAAMSDRILEVLLKDIQRADVVILDEFGCIPLDVDGARLLFQVISDSYEARSLILTTNIEFNGLSRRMGASLMFEKGGD